MVGFWEKPEERRLAAKLPVFPGLEEAAARALAPLILSLVARELRRRAALAKRAGDKVLVKHYKRLYDDFVNSPRSTFGKVFVFLKRLARWLMEALGIDAHLLSVGGSGALSIGHVLMASPFLAYDVELSLLSLIAAIWARSRLRELGLSEGGLKAFIHELEPLEVFQKLIDAIPRALLKVLLVVDDIADIPQPVRSSLLRELVSLCQETAKHEGGDLKAVVCYRVSMDELAKFMMSPGEFLKKLFDVSEEELREVGVVYVVSRPLPNEDADRLVGLALANARAGIRDVLGPMLAENKRARELLWQISSGLTWVAVYTLLWLNEALKRGRAIEEELKAIGETAVRDAIVREFLLRRSPWAGVFAHPRHYKFPYQHEVIERLANAYRSVLALIYRQDDVLKGFKYVAVELASRLEMNVPLLLEGELYALWELTRRDGDLRCFMREYEPRLRTEDRPLEFKSFIISLIELGLLEDITDQQPEVARRGERAYRLTELGEHLAVALLAFLRLLSRGSGRYE